MEASHQRGLQLLKESRASLHATEHVAQTTSVELARQRDKLGNIADTNKSSEGMLDRASMHLKSLLFFWKL